LGSIIVYFDVFTAQWKKLPQESEFNKQEIAESYLGKLDPDEDRDEIERIIEDLQQLLEP
jgi:hypothetical protein